MAQFDDDTLRAFQVIYEALQKLEGGMAKLAGALGGDIDEDVHKNNTIGPELHTLRNIDQRIWPPRH